MNKIKSVTVLCCLIFSLLSFAQDKFSSYDNTYYGKRYDIIISLKGTSYSLWVDALSLEYPTKLGGIVVRENNFFNFLESLKMAKLKYDEYSRKAKMNGVKHEDKNMRIFNTVDVYTIQDSKYVFSDIDLNFDFKVRQKDDQVYNLLFISADEYNLVFASSAEIQDFIDKLSSEKINEYVIKNQDISFTSTAISPNVEHRKLAKEGYLSKITIGLKMNVKSYFGVNNYSSDQIANSSVLNSTTQYLNAYGFGGFIRLPFDKFLIQPELIYSMCSVHNIMSFFNKNIRQVEIATNMKISNISLPLLLGYKIFQRSNTGLRVLAGPSLSFDVSSEVSYPFLSTYGSTVYRDITYKKQPVKIGLSTGIEFDLFSFAVGARYNLISNSYNPMYDLKLMSSKLSNFFEFSLGWKLFQN